MQNDFTNFIKEKGSVKYKAPVLQSNLYTKCYNILGGQPELLHEKFSYPDYNLNESERNEDETTKLFYASMDEDFINHYYSFVKENVLPHFYDDKKILVQAKPAIRIQGPNSKAISHTHRDSDGGHHQMETNIFLPITEAKNSSTIWAESRSGSNVFVPLNTSINEFWIWDGANCLHKNKINVTNNTRVSFDFRILPKKYYTKEFARRKTITLNKSFSIGDYWEEF